MFKPVDLFFSKEKAIDFLKEQRSLFPGQIFEISNKYNVIKQVVEQASKFRFIYEREKENEKD